MVSAHHLPLKASLFSAILTSFTMEAAKAIAVDPAEKMVDLLQTLVLQVNHLSNPQTNVPVNLTPGSSIFTTPHAEEICLLYSVSLTLSLIAVLGGITCLQWLREFNRNITGVSHDSDIYLQYLRHRGLQSWGALALLNTLPILLIITLFLFFAGFLTSQWGSNTLAAKPVTVLVIIASLFIFATSCLPALQLVWLSGYTKHDFSLQDPSDEPEPPVLCPYRSPQSWLVHCVFRSLLHLIHRIWPHKLEPRSLITFDKIDNWTSYDMWWTDKHKTMKSIYPALIWVATEFKQNEGSTILAVHKCFMSAIVDTNCEYICKLGERYRLDGNRTSVPSNAWISLFEFTTLANFEEEFMSRRNSISISRTRFEAFSQIWKSIHKWSGRELESTIFPWTSDLYRYLRAETLSDYDGRHSLTFDKRITVMDTII